MEDYEIDDVRRRRIVIAPLVSVELLSRRGGLMYLIVGNKGDAPALDVVFQFPANFQWLEILRKPNIFSRGIKSLSPDREFHFLYHRFADIVREESQIAQSFDVSVTYTHPAITQRLTEVFHLDALDYSHSEIHHSELFDLTAKINDTLKNLGSQIEKIHNDVEQLAPLGDATGLSLSIPTLRNLRRLLDGEKEAFEKIDPIGCDWHIFKEILGVDTDMALRLQRFFNWQQPDNINHIENITIDLLHKITKHFHIPAE